MAGAAVNATDAVSKKFRGWESQVKIAMLALGNMSEEMENARYGMEYPDSGQLSAENLLALDRRVLGEMAEALQCLGQQAAETLRDVQSVLKARGAA